MEQSSNDQDDKKSTGLDFSGLILGFSSAALYHIGHTEIDNQKTQEPNFALAEQNIEIIRILQSKTKGNLDTQETKLISDVLKDLESKYTQAKNEV